VAKNSPIARAGDPHPLRRRRHHRILGQERDEAVEVDCGPRTRRQRKRRANAQESAEPSRT
jgi:hypothetical protein